MRLSRASYREMVQNLVWASGYNIVALPLAAGVLAPWGILLSSAVGAILHVGEHHRCGAERPTTAAAVHLRSVPEAGTERTP
jgi:hypothetical protein